MPNATTILGIVLACALGGVLAGPAAAQDPAKDAKRLEQLLEQLSLTKPTTWQARLKTLESAAKGHETRAQSMRRQASAEAGKAAAVRAEIDRLKRVMAILATVKPGPKVARKPARKPIPKKTMPRKASPKKATPKKASPKKANAKEGSAGEGNPEESHRQEGRDEEAFGSREEDDSKEGADAKRPRTAVRHLRRSRAGHLHGELLGVSRSRREGRRGSI